MLGILCGLESEAVIARKIPGARVELSHANMRQARAMAQKLVDEGATRLISFGIAGGLAPELRSGDFIISSLVKTQGKEWQGDETWAAELRQKNPNAKGGAVWGSEYIVNEIMAKRCLFAESNCEIVDMESHVVAEAAAGKGIPFIAVRAVIDAVNTVVPQAALIPLKPNGKEDLLGVVLSLLCNPLQLPALIRIGLHLPKALKTLDGFVKAMP